MVNFYCLTQIDRESLLYTKICFVSTELQLEEVIHRAWIPHAPMTSTMTVTEFKAIALATHPATVYVSQGSIYTSPTNPAAKLIAINFQARLHD